MAESHAAAARARTAGAGTPPSRRTSTSRSARHHHRHRGRHPVHPGHPERDPGDLAPRDVGGEVRPGGRATSCTSATTSASCGPLHRAPHHRDPDHPGPDGAVQRVRPAAARRHARSDMAHAVPGPAGPPPLGPDGFDWTAWNADPTWSPASSRWAAPTRSPSAGGGAGRPDAPVEPLKIALRSRAPCSCCSARSPAPSTTCPTTTCSARTWSSTCCSPSPCRRSCCTGRRGGCWRRSSAPRAWSASAGPSPDPARRFALQPRDRGRGTCRPSTTSPWTITPLHIVRHLMILAAAVAPVVAGALAGLAPAPRAPYPIQLLYLFVVGLPMVMVSIFITMADSVLYPYYAAAPRVWAELTPHADQHLGGLIMWIPGGWSSSPPSPWCSSAGRSPAATTSRCPSSESQSWPRSAGARVIRVGRRGRARSCS